ncbi:MAG: GNAT family N-acetyltransferase [Planctomycetes bacterium]|nr:GNAT family N-acetyltransferase [Planctomycetota bacterium]
MELSDIAMLEEGRLCNALEVIAPESRRLAGGLLTRGDPGTWINTTSGLGMGLGATTPVTAADVDALIAWFEEKGIEPRAEVCPFAHPSTWNELGKAGFVIRTFENVFVADLVTSPARSAPQPLGDGITIVRVDRYDGAAVRAYAQAICAGFTHPTPPPKEDIELWMRVVREDNCIALAAMDGDRVVGGGCTESARLTLRKEAHHTSHSMAILFGLSVLPEYRKRGIQQAMIAERLKLARADGAQFATISARPGVATERNARRMGFEVAYTKAIVVRPGPGLRAND